MSDCVESCRKRGGKVPKFAKISLLPAFFALDSPPLFRYNRNVKTQFAQESPSGMASASQADPGGFDSRFLLHMNKGHSFEGRMLLCLFDLAEGSTSEAEVLPFPAPTHQEMPFRTEGRCSFYKRYQKRGSPWKKRCGAPASNGSKKNSCPRWAAPNPSPSPMPPPLRKRRWACSPSALRSK